MVMVEEPHPAVVSVEHMAPDSTEVAELRAALYRTTVLLHRAAHEGDMHDCEDCRPDLALYERGNARSSENSVRKPIRAT